MKPDNPLTQEYDDAIRNAIGRQRRQHIDRLRELITIPSPVGSEAAIQQHIAGCMQELDAQVDIFEADLDALRSHPEYAHHPDDTSGDGRPNVVGRIRGTGDGASLLIYAHPDTQRLPAPNTWTTEPLTGIEREGRLYALGAADDKAGIAAMLGAAHLLQALAIRLRGDLILVSSIGKRGGAAGTLAVIERGYGADGVIYAHPAETGRGYGDIKTLTRGVLPFTVHVQGKRPAPIEIGTPHNALPSQGVSAIAKAIDVLSALHVWYEQLAENLHHPLLDAQLGQSTTLTVGEIESSTGYNLVSEWCRFRGQLTFPPGQTLHALRDELSTALSQACRRDPWLANVPPTLDIGGPRANPAETDPNHPFVKLAGQTIQDVTGVRPHPYPGHMQSDIRFPVLHSGMPTVGFGPTGGNFYMADEWVDVDGYVQHVAILALLAARWCGVDTSVAGSP